MRVKWKQEDITTLLDMVTRHASIKTMAKRLGRDVPAIRSKLFYIRQCSRGESTNYTKTFSPTKPITAIVSQDKIERMYAGRKYQDIGL